MGQSVFGGGPGPTILDWYIGLETAREIVAALSPKQLAVAILRADGLNDADIAALFGVARSAVSNRMQDAKLRIVAACPELASELEGRTLKRASAFGELRGRRRGASSGRVGG